MLFAISGSQGSGKTTVLAKLEELGYPTIKRKTSRSIMDEWGVTLSEVNNNRELTVKFQEEILKRKQDDEDEAVHDVSRIWFTERTYADLFTYALISIGKDNEYSDWINDYFERCKELQKLYAHNFYLVSGIFNIEHDGVRGVNQHYVQMVDLTMKDVLKRMVTGTTEVSSPTVSARANDVLNTISEYAPCVPYKTIEEEYLQRYEGFSGKATPIS